MTCSVAQRNALRDAARRLQDHDAVEVVEVLGPEADATPVDQWSLELTLASEGVDPAICTELAARQLTVRLSRPRGDDWYALIV